MSSIPCILAPWTWDYTPVFGLIVDGADMRGPTNIIYDHYRIVTGSEGEASEPDERPRLAQTGRAAYRSDS